MAKPQSRLGSDTGKGAEIDSPPGTPRWVKAFGIVSLLLVLLFVVLHLTGNGLGGHTAAWH